MGIAILYLSMPPKQPPQAQLLPQAELILRAKQHNVQKQVNRHAVAVLLPRNRGQTQAAALSAPLCFVNFIHYASMQCA